MNKQSLLETLFKSCTTLFGLVLIALAVVGFNNDFLYIVLIGVGIFNAIIFFIIMYNLGALDMDKYREEMYKQLNK